ncbi:MAG: rRNA maturation RNase YbeY [Bacteroidetes bacterium]|nr:rRNA maturation RNase YbeY [Bacteroidota bacterium]
MSANSNISFFNDGIKFTLKNKKKIIAWIETIIKQNKYKIENINYVFCNDKYLHTINLKFLHHDTYTDIITFDYSDKKSKTVSADIFISIERVKENAQTLKTSFSLELQRVLIHGVLHLLGYKDKTKAQKVAMRKLEDKCLSLFK